MKFTSDHYCWCWMRFMQHLEVMGEFSCVEAPWTAWGLTSQYTGPRDMHWTQVTDTLIDWKLKTTLLFSSSTSFPSHLNALYVEFKLAKKILSERMHYKGIMKVPLMQSITHYSLPALSTDSTVIIVWLLLFFYVLVIGSLAGGTQASHSAQDNEPEHSLP